MSWTRIHTGKTPSQRVLGWFLEGRKRLKINWPQATLESVWRHLKVIFHTMNIVGTIDVARKGANAAPISLTKLYLYITSTTTGETFEIKGRINCDSSYVIYVLMCDCGLQYDGRTSQKWCIRINQHRSNVSRGYLKHSVSHHSAIHHGCNFNHFFFSAIEKNPNKLLARREMYWIFKFDTLVPNDFNEALEQVY